MGAQWGESLFHEVQGAALQCVVGLATAMHFERLSLANGLDPRVVGHAYDRR